MRKMPGLLVTCVVALVCGFLGALAAVTVFQDQLAGPQGATGLQGLPGEPGQPGADGVDGTPGERGPRGRSGKAGQAAAEVPLNIGTEDCLGRSVQVITDATMRNDELELERETVCVVE